MSGLADATLSTGAIRSVIDSLAGEGGEIAVNTGAIEASPDAFVCGAALVFVDANRSAGFVVTTVRRVAGAACSRGMEHTWVQAAQLEPRNQKWSVVERFG